MQAEMQHTLPSPFDPTDVCNVLMLGGRGAAAGSSSTQAWLSMDHRELACALQRPVDGWEASLLLLVDEGGALCLRRRHIAVPRGGAGGRVVNGSKVVCSNSSWPAGQPFYLNSKTKTLPSFLPT